MFPDGDRIASYTHSRQARGLNEGRACAWAGIAYPPSWPPSPSVQSSSTSSVLWSCRYQLRRLICLEEPASWVRTEGPTALRDHVNFHLASVESPNCVSCTTCRCLKQDKAASLTSLASGSGRVDLSSHRALFCSLVGPCSPRTLLVRALFHYQLVARSCLC
jgi:hypothetical protein